MHLKSYKFKSVIHYCTEILNRAQLFRFLLVVSFLPTSEPGTTEGFFLLRATFPHCYFLLKVRSLGFCIASRDTSERCCAKYITVCVCPYIDDLKWVELNWRWWPWSCIPKIRHHGESFKLTFYFLLPRNSERVIFPDLPNIKGEILFWSPTSSIENEPRSHVLYSDFYLLMPPWFYSAFVSRFTSISITKRSALI